MSCLEQPFFFLSDTRRCRCDLYTFFNDHNFFFYYFHIALCVFIIFFSLNVLLNDKQTGNYLKIKNKTYLFIYLCWWRLCSYFSVSLIKIQFHCHFSFFHSLSFSFIFLSIFTFRCCRSTLWFRVNLNLIYLITFDDFSEAENLNFFYSFCFGLVDFFPLFFLWFSI